MAGGDVTGDGQHRSRVRDRCARYPAAGRRDRSAGLGGLAATWVDVVVGAAPVNDGASPGPGRRLRPAPPGRPGHDDGTSRSPAASRRRSAPSASCSSVGAGAATPNTPPNLAVRCWWHQTGLALLLGPDRRQDDVGEMKGAKTGPSRCRPEAHDSCIRYRTVGVTTTASQPRATAWSHAGREDSEPSANSGRPARPGNSRA